jgi:pilus assembly protein FimV
VREGGRVVQPLDATTMPQTVAPAVLAAKVDEPPALDAGSALDLDIDLDLGASQAEPAPTAAEATRPFTTGASIADDSAFTLDAMPSAKPTARPAPASALESLDFDLGDLSLDTAPASTTAAAPARDDFSASLPALDIGEDSDPLARKLELAEEFRQIGDMEGARDLLEEVIAHADGALKAKAQGMLAKLA